MFQLFQSFATDIYFTITALHIRTRYIFLKYKVYPFIISNSREHSTFKYIKSVCWLKTDRHNPWEYTFKPYYFHGHDIILILIPAKLSLDHPPTLSFRISMRSASSGIWLLSKLPRHLPEQWERKKEKSGMGRERENAQLRAREREGDVERECV